MGVTTLWDILAPAEEKDVMVSSLRGSTLAVDLSIWIAELRQAVKENQTVFFRNLFYRILGFMSEGIKLVIVIDGRAPTLKLDAMQDRQRAAFGSSSYSVNPDRPWMAKIVQECVEMLESLGLPLVYSKGEAEATCAHLNATQLVDGCLSNDSDYFCYGGKVLYRNLRKISRGYVVDRVTMSRVTTNPGLNQRDLIALALLIGCDYDKKGVKSIGKEKAAELVKNLKMKGHDALKRLEEWRTNQELITVDKRLSQEKQHLSHCRKCDHLGKISVHKKTGCSTCMTQSDCVMSCDTVCTCDWHKQKKMLQDNKLEISIWRKAMENKCFPNQKIIDEFLSPGTDNQVDVAIKQMNVMRLVTILSPVVHKQGSDLLDKLVPCYILQQLYHPTLYTTLMFLPIRINKQCKFKDVSCYEVSWDKTDKNDWKIEHHSTSVPVKVEMSLLKVRYPALVSQFEEEKAAKTPRGKKRKKKTEENRKVSEGSITRFLNVKRRLDYPEAAGRDQSATAVDLEDIQDDGASINNDERTGAHIKGESEEAIKSQSRQLNSNRGTENNKSKSTMHKFKFSSHHNSKTTSLNISIDTDESSDDGETKNNTVTAQKGPENTNTVVTTDTDDSSDGETDGTIGVSNKYVPKKLIMDRELIGTEPIASSSRTVQHSHKKKHSAAKDREQKISSSGLWGSTLSNKQKSSQSLNGTNNSSNVLTGLNDSPTIPKIKKKDKKSKSKNLCDMKNQRTLEGFFKKSN